MDSLRSMLMFFLSSQYTNIFPISFPFCDLGPPTVIYNVGTFLPSALPTTTGVMGKIKAGSLPARFWPHSPQVLCRLQDWQVKIAITKPIVSAGLSSDCQKGVFEGRSRRGGSGGGLGLIGLRLSAMPYALSFPGEPSAFQGTRRLSSPRQARGREASATAHPSTT